MGNMFIIVTQRPNVCCIYYPNVFAIYSTNAILKVGKLLELLSNL